MTALDRPLTGHQVAAGLIALAVMFDHGDIPTRTHPNQGVRVSIPLASGASVREVAARCGVEVRDESGWVSCEVPLGTGTNPGSDQAAYAGAVSASFFAIVAGGPR